MSRRPVMPSELADVPAWLRHQAHRWSLRVLFLADELEDEIGRRQALRDAAADAGVRIVDLPRGLTDDEMRAFMAREIAATPENRPALPPHVPAEPIEAAEVGAVLGTIAGDLLAPLPGARAELLKCAHCDCWVRAGDMLRHTRDYSTLEQRPQGACPALWVRRGGAL